MKVKETHQLVIQVSKRYSKRLPKKRVQILPGQLNFDRARGYLHINLLYWCTGFISMVGIKAKV